MRIVGLAARPFACFSLSHAAPSAPYTRALPLPGDRISTCDRGLLRGCGGGGAVSNPPPPPPPPSIVVKVTPGASTVLLGNTQLFAAEVSNTTNTNVTWSVNGIVSGNNAVGAISANGLFTAPVDLPSSTAVQVTATSAADTTKSGSAQITLTSDIAISLTPGIASVELGATQNLHASLTSSSHPDNTVLWSLSGASCPAACGSVDANGNYTAPQILPFAAGVVARAQSAADPSKFATAAVNITSNFALQISVPGTVATNGSVTVVATLTPVPGSNPSPNLTWALSGNGCSGNACGTLVSTTTQFDAHSVEVSSANYLAPASAPSPNTVTITVTSSADPNKKAQASIAIQTGVNVNLSPGTAALAANHRVTLTTQVSGTSNTNLNWSVNGIAGGNAASGQLCVVGSSPCQVVSTGNAPQVVDYLAPGTSPSPNPVTVQATSVADPTRSATSQITVINHVLVSVLPGSATLAPLAVQGFTANVLGSSNQTVTWQVQGTGCAVAGSCGTVTATGTYTAPPAAPAPNAIRVIAISADDVSQFGAANVSISTGANILKLSPASVYAGEANGFTLRVDGSGLVATSSGTGSTLLIGGVARTTTCSTANECTVAINAADTQTDGNVSAQIQNPDGKKSNSVSLVVVAPSTSADSIALSSSSPTATGEDIVVVDPTTAGVSQPANDVDLDIAALGSFSSATNSCTLAGNPLPLSRPTTGVSTAEICIFSQSGLDTSMTYTVSGSGEISVIAKQPAGLGIIHLTLQVQSSAQPGARTLFIQNLNLDKAAASGVLEVQ